jgi:hypothetical protein
MAHAFDLFIILFVILAPLPSLGLFIVLAASLENRVKSIRHEHNIKVPHD